MTRSVSAPTGRPAALVTGSAKGLGRALLLALAADGYDVGVQVRSSFDEAAEVRAHAERLGARAVTLRGDLSVEADAVAVVQGLHRAFGRIDVLINNIGDYHHGPIDALDSNTWHAMFDSNLHTTFHACQAAVPLMRQAGAGRIINIGYAGAENLVARPGIVAYGIAKTGVILYSKALAKAEASHGITVNVVSPGVLENSVTQPTREIPMGRTGRLEEVAAAVRYLLSPEAAYITGVTIEVAGGWNL